MFKDTLFTASPMAYLCTLLLAAGLSGTALAAPEGYTVQTVASPNWFALEASIEAVNEATISAQTSGRIKTVAVDVNDYVSEGQVLITLRDKKQKAALERARAQVKQAQALSVDAQNKLKRSTAVFKQGGISKGSFDSIKAQAISSKAAVKASQALLKQAQEQFDYTRIRAPYAGIVKARHVQVGETVNPGSRLMTGLSLKQLRAVADIPQRFTPHLNQQKEFQIIHGKKIIRSNKAVLFPYADETSHSFKIRVEFNSQDSNLFPGMWVKLNVPMGEKNTLPVPLSAIMQKGELSSVYVLTPQGPKLRQVRLGQRLINTKGENMVNVLAGLRVGETVALNALDVLSAMGK